MPELTAQAAALYLLAWFVAGTVIALWFCRGLRTAARTRDRIDDQARAAAIAEWTWADYFASRTDPRHIDRLGGDTPMFEPIARLYVEAEETAAREAASVVAEAERYAKEAAS